MKGTHTFLLIQVNVPDTDVRTNAIIVTKADIKCRHFNSHVVVHLLYFLKVNWQSLGLIRKNV